MNFRGRWIPIRSHKMDRNHSAVVSARPRAMAITAVLVNQPSKTSLTFEVRFATENGFCRKCTPSSRMPC